MDYKYKDLYTTSNSVDKQLRIATDDGYVIDNETLNSEDFALTESLCSDNELVFGSCEAAQVKFRVSEVAEPLKGRWFTVSEVLDGNTDEPFSFGRYKVESDIPTADRAWRDVTAYDAMYDIINADVSGWYNSLNFPMTLKAFRSSFISYFGLQEVSVELVNDNMIVTKGLFVSETTETTIGEVLSGKDVISCICEANGVFGHINRNGYFEYKSLDNSSAGEDISELYVNGSVKYEDYTTNQISKLQIRTGENDIGVIVGTDGNEYIIQGNFLFYGKEIDELQAIANTLLGKIRYVSYIPFSNEAQGNPCIEVGDKVVFDTARKRITSFVLNRTIKGIQSLKDKYEAKGSEKYSEKVNGSHQSILELKGRYNTLERNIEGTASRVGVIEQDYTKYTEFQQTVDGLTATVKSIESEIDGSINVYYTEEEPTLLNYPAWDFTLNIPCNNTVQTTDDLHFEYKPEYYQKFLRSVVYDENNSSTYRFSKDKENETYYWSPATDTEFGVAMEKIAELNVRADGITASVEENTRDILNQGALIESNSSKITQTAESIESEVRRASSQEGELFSKISQTAHSIELSVDNSKGVSSGITIRVLDENGKELDKESATIILSGLVAFEDLAKEGKTIINGSNITTGTISCDLLNGGTINGQDIKGGKIIQEFTYYDRNTGETEIGLFRIYNGSIWYSATKENPNWIRLTKWNSNRAGLDMIFDHLQATDITSPKFLVDESGNIKFQISGQRDPVYFHIDSYSEEPNLILYNGFLMHDAGYGTRYGDNFYVCPRSRDNIIYANVIQVFYPDRSGIVYQAFGLEGYSSLTPSINGEVLLGSPSYKWGQIYSTNSTISTSDRREKDHISYIGQDSEYEDTYMSDEQLCQWIEGLQPVVYHLIDGTSGRPHHGLIAQDIEVLMNEIGIKDHASFIKSPLQKEVSVEKIAINENGEKEIVKELAYEDIDGEYKYALRYEELIADTIRYCQIQHKKNIELETELNQVKTELSELKALVNSLVEREV